VEEVTRALANKWVLLRDSGRVDEAERVAAEFVRRHGRSVGDWLADDGSPSGTA
jgi:hypothetical protein